MERADKSNRVNDRLEEFLKASGLKIARQSYEYNSAGQTYRGENIYAILHAPRGDATEAIVLVGAWRNVEGELNRSGVALILTLARYFKRTKPRLVRCTELMLGRLVFMVERYHFFDYRR